MVKKNPEHQVSQPSDETEILPGSTTVVEAPQTVGHIQAAPDEETKPDATPADTPESKQPESAGATQALPTHPKPRTATPIGRSTSPLSVDSHQLAENRDRPSGRDKDTQPNPVMSPDRSTGPQSAESQTPRFVTTPMDKELPLPRSGMPSWVWALAGAAVTLLLVAGVWFFFLRPASEQSQEAPPPEAASAGALAEAPAETPKAAVVVEVPPALRPYLDKARKGDAKAMTMLAVMYCNGLNVRQDKTEGRKWYEKAAGAGNPTAKKWLADNPEK